MCLMYSALKLDCPDSITIKISENKLPSHSFQLNSKLLHLLWCSIQLEKYFLHKPTGKLQQNANMHLTITSSNTTLTFYYKYVSPR
jgi:hypothetical protein